MHLSSDQTLNTAFDSNQPCQWQWRSGQGRFRSTSMKLCGGGFEFHFKIISCISFLCTNVRIFFFSMSMLRLGNLVSWFATLWISWCLSFFALNLKYWLKKSNYHFMKIKQKPFRNTKMEEHVTLISPLIPFSLTTLCLSLTLS